MLPHSVSAIIQQQIAHACRSPHRNHFRSLVHLASTSARFANAHISGSHNVWTVSKFVCNTSSSHWALGVFFFPIKLHLFEKVILARVNGLIGPTLPAPLVVSFLFEVVL